MQNDDYTEVIQTELDRLSKRKGHSSNCEISIVSDQSLSITKNGELVDLFIKPGDPPKLFVTFIFLARTLFVSTPNVRLFRDRMDRALERLPLMRRTLSRNLNPSLALILRSDNKKWLRTKLDVTEDLPEDTFTIVYSAKITEKISGITLEVTGSRKEIENEINIGRHRLSQIVQGKEEISNFRHLLKEMRDNKIPDQNPATKISIVSDESGQAKEIREY